MAKNPYLSQYMTPCKWGKRPWRQSRLRRVSNFVKTLNYFKDGF